MSSSSSTSQSVHGNSGSGDASSTELDVNLGPFALLFRNLIAAQKRLEECNKTHSELEANLPSPMPKKNGNTEERKQKGNNLILAVNFGESQCRSFEAEEEVFECKRLLWKSILNPRIDINYKKFVHKNFPWDAMSIKVGSSLYNLIQASSDFSSKEVTKAIKIYIEDLDCEEESMKPVKELVKSTLNMGKECLATCPR